MSSMYVRRVSDTGLIFLLIQQELFPLTNYMEKQQDITPQMRAILVDWLVEVQECFELYHETLYLGVKLLDHFLERSTIKRDELQLVGATTLLISSKIEVI